MKKYILALDEGTTSARSILFDHNCKIVSSSQQEFAQHYPYPGWVEQDPMEIYATQYATLTQCIAKSGISIDEIAGIGITNQRETTILWNKTTGKPIYNAIVWQCRRTAEICDDLIKQGYSEYIQKATNEMLDYILPQKDCPGIYKITNDRNKKSYIGRSTSVRKRLADHIKSAIGISTIANQKIHEVMREEGIWNFTFELIEECDKDKLNEREKYYIDFFQTADTTYGYNQKAGG